MKKLLADEPRILEQLELLASIDDVVEANLPLLTAVGQSWQPTDWLPDLVGEGWRDNVESFRERASAIPDDVLVVLVGNMVTEEALPNYAISLNLLARDYSGDSKTAWARWMRGWTAEENRHGDLLNAYLRLTGRVDMRAVEVTVHHLIVNGFNPKSYPDPYAGLIYTSFQERATKVSHAKVGRLAMAAGDTNLGRICGKVAADESRHEQFYTRMMSEVISRDPGEAMLVFRDLMRRVIAMPGKLMDDGKDPSLFEHFAVVAQRMGVYTVQDYAQIMRHLVGTWDIANQSVTGKAAAAQEFLCNHADRLESLADSMSADVSSRPPVKFSWIFDRAV